MIWKPRENRRWVTQLIRPDSESLIRLVGEPWNLISSCGELVYKTSSDQMVSIKVRWMSPIAMSYQKVSQWNFFRSDESVTQRTLDQIMIHTTSSDQRESHPTSSNKCWAPQSHQITRWVLQAKLLDQMDLSSKFVVSAGESLKLKSSDWEPGKTCQTRCLGTKM